MDDKQEAPPLLGGFEGSEGEAPTVPRKTQEKPQEEETSSEAEETRSAAPKKPLTYEEGLEEAGVDIVEARQIMERLATDDYYEESAQIGPLRMVMRTRLYKDTVRTQQLIEAENPTYNMTLSELAARYNLAASLGGLGERKFPFISPEDDEEGAEKAFNKCLRYVMARPEKIIFKMMQKLHDFDVKVAAVFADGSPEDF